MVGVESNPKLHTLSLRVTAVSNLRLTAENLSQVPSLTRLSFQVTAFNNPTQPIDTSAAPPASPMPMTGDNMSEGSGSPRIPVMFGGTQRQRLDDMRRIALAQAAVRAHESPLRALPVPMRATRDDAATTAGTLPPHLRLLSLACVRACVRSCLSSFGELTCPVCACDLCRSTGAGAVPRRRADGPRPQ